MTTFHLNNRVQRRLQTWLGILAVMLMMLGSVSAQSFKATVVGQITDANGAVIPGATVTIVDKGTARTLIATSNDEGSFTISQIPPGNYEVSVEAANFKRSVRSDLVLETDQTQRLNFTLEAGNVSEMVQVISVAPVINSETSDKGEVITNRQVQELPLNGRDATDLAQLVPGVYQRPAEDDQGQGSAIVGTRTDSTNFILDGANTRSDRNGGIGVNTSVDSIRQFKFLLRLTRLSLDALREDKSTSSQSLVPTTSTARCLNMSAMTDSTRLISSAARKILSVINSAALSEVHSPC